jgi:hypothetical protein
VLDEPFALQATTNEQNWSTELESEMTWHLKLLQRMRNVLDGHFGAQSVHVVQIDVAADEARERLVQLLPDAVQRRTVRHARGHELRGDHCSIALTAQQKWANCSRASLD